MMKYPSQLVGGWNVPASRDRYQPSPLHSRHSPAVNLGEIKRLGNGSTSSMQMSQVFHYGLEDSDIWQIFLKIKLLRSVH